MANIATLPDEIIEHILQAIYDESESGWQRDFAFLEILKVLPHWIPILLDSCFFMVEGKRSTMRYELVWGYRHLVYLDEMSGTWQMRDEKWQPRGAKIVGWKCRNGETSHVEVEEEVSTSLSDWVLVSGS